MGDPGQNGIDGSGRGASALCLRSLCVTVAGKIVLHPITLDIPRRSVTALLGDSGSGKSVLLRALNRMHETQADIGVTGEVFMGGENILCPHFPLNEVRRQLGMVFPEPTPFPMSVWANLVFALNLHAKLTRKECQARVEAVLARAGLWPALRGALRQPAAALSASDQQRLCIARTLAVGAEILLLDDPTRNLDMEGSLALEELFDALKSELTIVLATTDRAQAARCGDLVALLKDGALANTGSAARVLLGTR